MYVWSNNKVEKLPHSLNSEFIEWDPYIAPDNSYILFCSGRTGGKNKDTDIYVVFKKNDGNWSNAKRLENGINTAEYETAATITPDGKHLVFTRNYSSGMKHYWISTQVIEQMR
jgi:Tol biopolymer transport system component